MSKSGGSQQDYGDTKTLASLQAKSLHKVKSRGDEHSLSINWVFNLRRHRVSSRAVFSVNMSWVTRELALRNL
jgi:hypothetical protein